MNEWLDMTNFYRIKSYLKISPFLFTPSEGGSQSRVHGRVVLHPTCEGDSCFQRLLQREEKHAEEVHFPAVVVHHLKTLRLARWHGVHQPI